MACVTPLDGNQTARRGPNPMSIRVARRIEIERAIIERLVSDALFFNGYTVTHSDGEALIVERS
jgi:hypothetical protein